LIETLKGPNDIPSLCQFERTYKGSNKPFPIEQNLASVKNEITLEHVMITTRPDAVVIRFKS
jgi:hypothetical protein